MIRRHQSQVRNFLRRLTRDDTLADDLAQDCFIHAWNKIHTYSGTGSFIGWVLRIAYTTFLQSKRRSKRYREILEQIGQESEAKENLAPPGDELGDLDRFLAVLEREERAIMILSYACGLSHREIGQAVGMPVGTVKSIIFRAKDKIRTRFAIEDGQKDRQEGHQHG